MFSLEEEISIWRRTINEHEAFTSDDIAELEDHLRAEFDILTSAPSLTEAEAFWIACRRIGSLPELALEFNKVNRKSIWIGRFQWMLLGYLFVSLLLKGVHVLSLPAASLAATFSESGLVTSALYTLSSVILWGCVAYGLYLVVMRNKSGMMQASYQRSIAFVHTKHKAIIIILALLPFILVELISRVAPIIFVRSLSMMEFGQFSYGMALYQLGLSALLPLGLLITVFWLNQYPLPLKR